MPYSAYYDGSPHAIFIDQLKTSAIGFVAMILISKLDYRILNGRLAWVAFYLTIAVLAATILIAKITGAETGRWLNRYFCSAFRICKAYNDYCTVLSSDGNAWRITGA